MVTGRFADETRDHLVRIRLTDGTRFRSTPRHPVWSVDRRSFVPAGDLHPGERLDTLDGPVRVVAVEDLSAGEAVHNLEVHNEHLYRVAQSGVLVHNSCDVDQLGLARMALSDLYAGVSAQRRWPPVRGGSFFRFVAAAAGFSSTRRASAR